MNEKDNILDFTKAELIEKKMFLLEYNEKTGNFHHNYTPWYGVDTYGWTSIAFTEDKKAQIFGMLIDCINDQRKRDKDSLMSADDVKKAWMLYTIAKMYGSLEYAGVTDSKLFELIDFNLARCGNGRYVDDEVFETIKRQGFWKYNPLSYKDSQGQ